jgi:hypothetical protein
MGFIKRNPKRSLSALATLLLAVGLVMGSGAFFQSTDANGPNTVSAGDIDLQAYGNGSSFDARDCAPRESTNSGVPGPGPANSNSPDAEYNGCDNSQSHSSTNQFGVRSGGFTISNMEPGQTVRTRLMLKNGGSLPAVSWVKGTFLNGGALWNALYLRVYKRPDADNGEPGNEIYRGPLNQFDDQWRNAVGQGGAEALDTLTNNEAELYDFFVKLPETGVDQTSLESQSVTFQVDWLGRDQGTAQDPNTTP